MTSTRAEIITLRTYCRPTNEDATEFETWDDVCQRVTEHQHWLWKGAKKEPLNDSEILELTEFRQLMRERKVTMAGRTLWLGGTALSRRREVSQFNCAFTRAETIHDVVDIFWLLLNGCGVGFLPTPGVLNGFTRPISNIRVIRSERTSKGGREHNVETFKDGVWTISIGDSGEAWAKSIGKLLAGKYPAQEIVLDFSQIRPGGSRLHGYGWISSGDAVIQRGYQDICAILNRRAGQLLSFGDIHDIVNHLGTIQTGRRGAQIALKRYGNNGWKEFAAFKSNYWDDNPQRAQSNNSLLFYEKPTPLQLWEVFDLITQHGGSEPGIINMEEAVRRAPWVAGVNPCAEILLPNKGFCNLVEIDLAKFANDPHGLERAVYLIARANYRQTLVNLDDGVLQRAWHENNQFLRLCGVGVCGVVRRADLTPYDYQTIRNVAHWGAYSMADELGTERPKNVTTIKPGGTTPKIMDTTEGISRPAGRYIFNNINFNRHDNLLLNLADAGYKVWPNPIDDESMLVRFPVEWPDVTFGDEPESAVAQLDRYRMLMDNYVDQNCSTTITYNKAEVPSIVKWLLKNWDHYVGVSFMLRTDADKTAEDSGHPYLPQEVVGKEEFETYAKSLKPVDLAISEQFDPVDDACDTGFCPVR